MQKASYHGKRSMDAPNDAVVKVCLLYYSNQCSDYRGCP